MMQARCAEAQELSRKHAKAARERAFAGAVLHDLRRADALAHFERIAYEAYKEHVAVCMSCKAATWEK